MSSREVYLNTEKLDGLNDPNRRTFITKLDLGLIMQEGPHWCHSVTNEFCEWQNSRQQNVYAMRGFGVRIKSNFLN